MDFPFYGTYDSDSEGYCSGETWFKIDETLIMQSVTERHYYHGEDNCKDRWDYEIQRLGPHQVGNYLRYSQILPEQFNTALNTIKAIINIGAIP